MALPKILQGQRRLRFGFLVANGVAQAVVAVTMAILVQKSFDQLVRLGDAPALSSLLWFGSALSGTLLASAWLRWRSHVDAEQLGQGYIHSVRMKLFRHVTHIGSEGARQMSRGALMLRFVGDLTALRNWVSLGLARMTVSGLSAVLAIGALAVIEPVIAISVGVAVSGVAALAFALGPHLRLTTREVRRQRGRLAGTLNDRVTRIGVVEAFGQEQRERKRFDRLSRQLRAALIRQARTVGLLRSLSEASSGLASFCALFAGAVQVGMGMATPGAVVSAMVVAGFLAPRLQDLGRVYEYWNAALIAREKQEQLLALKGTGRAKSQRNGKPLLEGPGRLELIDLVGPGLAGPINLSVTAGERLCVVGPNGAGKSTLLRLVGGILRPHSGEIRLDGQNIAGANWSSLRAACALVSPDLPLLRGSLRLNLTYGAQSIDADRLHETLTLCGLDELLAKLPQGLETRISEAGEGLSSGERARIVIARALMVRPRLLLLDEADANLDTAAVAVLQHVIGQFPGTIIYTTHAQELEAQAHRVLHLDNGRLMHCEPTLTHVGERLEKVFYAPKTPKSTQETSR